MPDLTEAARLLAAFLLAVAITAASVPAAVALARRTGFFDSPAGYKSHLRPTPYLGGAAVFVAALLPVLLLGQVPSEYWPLLLGTLGLAILGTVDDRVNLSPWLRLAAEVAAAWLLWQEGLGWDLFDSELANFLLTALWVAGIVNAFNLMDNLDGAASSVAAVSAAATCALAVIGDAVALAVIAIGLCGALLGFLRHNLARPARIFLGDGGSMPIGFLLAALLMIVPMGDLSGWSALVAATLLVGLPVFDTALVVVSRRRRRAPVLSGATDHTTHRMRVILKTPQAVSLTLAVVQAVLCVAAIEVTRLGESAAVALGCSVLLVGMAAIAIAEGPRWIPLSDDS